MQCISLICGSEKTELMFFMSLIAYIFVLAARQIDIVFLDYLLISLLYRPVLFRGKIPWVFSSYLLGTWYYTHSLLELFQSNQGNSISNCSHALYAGTHFDFRCTYFSDFTGLSRFMSFRYLRHIILCFLCISSSLMNLFNLGRYCSNSSILLCPAPDSHNGSTVLGQAS